MGTDSKSTSFGKIDIINLAVLVAVMGIIFGLRLTDRSSVGEEPRYGTAAREMIDTGDWLVFRQQGQVFAERPPLTIWTVAAMGLVRGQFDVIAGRMTSILSIVLTSLLLYLYIRSFGSRFAAFSAGLIYPTTKTPLPDGVEYFVFMRRSFVTPAKRYAGRGRSWYTTLGTVPFEWEELTSIDCNRVNRGADGKKVVLGRVIRPLRAAASDVTQPRKNHSIDKAVNQPNFASSIPTGRVLVDEPVDTIAAH